MCMQCWDTEKREVAIKKGLACSMDKPWEMSLAELRYKVQLEWMNSGKTKFSVYKSCITDLSSSDSIEWIAKKGKTEEKISVHLV